jgi:uncharacterized protein YlzI (FlbEa/FlbD family)
VKKNVWELNLSLIENIKILDDQTLFLQSQLIETRSKLYFLYILDRSDALILKIVFFKKNIILIQLNTKYI